MANFNYRRFFIILRAKDTGFELHEKEPSGYCKIDIKNNRIKFFIYVQDLKPQTTEQGTYEAYIVSPGEEKPVYKLADIFVDNRGRAECTVESDTETLKRTTKSIEELSAIAVVYKSLTNTGKLHYPLAGSAGKRAEIDWSGRIMADILKASGTEQHQQQIQNKTNSLSTMTPEILLVREEQISKKAVETEEETPKQKDVTSIEVVLEKTISHEEMNPPKEAKSDEMIPTDEKLDHENVLPGDDLCSYKDTEQNEYTEIPNYAAVQAASYDELSDIEHKSEASQEESESEEIIVEKLETHDKIVVNNDVNPENQTNEAECLPFASTNYWDVMRDYFVKLSNENPRVYPFGYNDYRKWVKVEHIPDGYSKYCNQRAYMDFHSSDPLNRDPESLSHYLVGFIDKDEKTSCVIYGFPGYSYEQPPAYAIHGLSVWEPIKNGYGKGYWLIYIDAQTGDLVQRP